MIIIVIIVHCNEPEPMNWRASSSVCAISAKKIKHQLHGPFVNFFFFFVVVAAVIITVAYVARVVGCSFSF